MSKPLWNVKQAAAFLNVSTRTVWRMKKAGEIPFTMVRSSVRFDPDALREYKEEQTRREERHAGSG